MAKKKKTNRKIQRKVWTKEDTRTLKQHSKAKTAVDEISRGMKRTETALRQRARKMGLSLGHRR